jgi:hypothetical protein
VLPSLINLKSIRLHPGAFKSSFPYLVTVDKQDKISIRKFEIVEGYSPPVTLDEQKPGICNFDLSWSKQGSICTFQIVRSEPSEPPSRDHKYLTEELPDLSTYEIVKEEYPDELIRAFDII